MNSDEYKTVSSIIRIRYINAISQVKEPSKELSFDFLFYEGTENYIIEIITKALELNENSNVKVSISKLDRKEEPNNLCKCTISRYDDGYIVNDVMLIVNTLESFYNFIVYDIIRGSTIKDARSNNIISALTCLPYFLSFDIKADMLDELMKIVEPHYNRLFKNICELSNNKYKLAMNTKYNNDSVVVLINLITT